MLVSIDDSPEGIEIARETTEIFADLDLLEVDALAKLMPAKGAPDLQEPGLALMAGILKRQGYDQTEAESAVVSVCEAAHSLQQNFDGKVQKYLRSYGERMLSEFTGNFAFSRLSSAKANYAFANWLQNVLNMPVSSSSPSVKALSEKLGIEVPKLVEIADNNDINIALMDDWAADYLRREKAEAAS